MSSPSRQSQLPRLSTADLVRRRSHLVLVDAHGPPYFANGHIPGAVNLPPHDVMRLATTRIGDVRAPVVVYGAIGSSNAWIVAEQLLALGFRDVSLYEDGLEGWLAAGLPTEVIEDDNDTAPHPSSTADSSAGSRAHRPPTQDSGAQGLRQRRASTCPEPDGESNGGSRSHGRSTGPAGK